MTALFPAMTLEGIFSFMKNGWVTWIYIQIRIGVNLCYQLKYPKSFHYNLMIDLPLVENCFEEYQILCHHAHRKQLLPKSSKHQGFLYLRSSISVLLYKNVVESNNQIVCFLNLYSNFEYFGKKWNTLQI